MNNQTNGNVLFTLDIDWAPDFVIDSVAKYFSEANVKATWFVTHQSPAITRLSERPDLFELGIHPNFLSNSTQGRTPTQVLRYCMDIVPQATAMRTHSLMQSTPLLFLVMMQTRIVTDVSILCPQTPDLRPSVLRYQGRELLRIPFFWEDDIEIESHAPSWHINSLIKMRGIKIFNFHPMHIYLNSSSMIPYNSAKSIGSDLSQLAASQLNPFIQKQRGAKSIFIELLELARRDKASLRISDLRNKWLKQANSGGDEDSDISRRESR